jgi:MFS family permease
MAFFMFLSGIGGALRWTTLLAAAGDTAASGQRGRVMSMIQAASMIGIIGGPALGGFLGQRLSLSAPFFFSAVTDAISTLVLIFIYHEAAHQSGLKSRSQTTATRVWGIPAFWLISLVSFGGLFTGIGSRVTILPLYASRVLGMTPGQIGLVGSLGSLAMLVAVPIAAKLIDTKARTLMVSVSLTASAVFLIAMSKSTSIPMLLLFTSLQSFASGFLMPAPAAIAADLVGGESLGPVMGALQTISEVGWLAGPLVLGVIADIAGNYSTPLLVNAALLAMLAAFVAVFMKSKDPSA